MVSPARPGEPIAQQPVGLAHLRHSVLLAECDDLLRARISATLDALGYSVTQVASGPALLSEIESFSLQPALREPPAAIICAVHLPGLSGLEVISFLRCMRLTIPVIFITAYATPEVRREAERLRAVAVLDKPLSISHLCDLLRRILVISS